MKTPVGYSRSITTLVKIFDLIEDLESTLAQRIGYEEAATWCQNLYVALSQTEGLVRELDQLDALELDAPGHRNWQPFPEV